MEGATLLSEIRIVRPEIPFAQVPHQVIEDPLLSWKAKGLFSYLVGRPPGWLIHRADLVKRSTDGESGLRSGIKELETQAYLSISKTRAERGRIGGTVWELHIPELDSPRVENPHAVEPHVEDPHVYQEPIHQEGKNQEAQAIELMWDAWKNVTGRSRLQLTPNRRQRLGKVRAFIRKADGNLRSEKTSDERLLRVWAQMVTELWADPWRQEELSRHDPVNVYRGPEQIESWFLKAHDFLRNVDRTTSTQARVSQRRSVELAREKEVEERGQVVVDYWKNASTAEREVIEARATELAAKDFPGLDMEWVKRVTMKAATAEAAGVDLSESADNQQRRTA